MAEALTLKPCPFCGQAPISFPSGDGTGLMIQCITPDCVAPHTSYYGDGVAAAHWNRRPEPEALEGVIGRLTPWAMIEKWAPDGNGQLRIEPETANLLSSDLRTALRLLGEVEKALEAIQINAESEGDTIFANMIASSARSALDKIRKGLSSREPSPTTCAAPLASKLADQQHGASGAEEGD